MPRETNIFEQNAGSSSVVSNTRHLGFRAKTRSLKEGGELESSVRRESFVCSSPLALLSIERREKKRRIESLSLSFFSLSLSMLSVSKTRSFEEFSAPLAKLGGI